MSLLLDPKITPCSFYIFFKSLLLLLLLIEDRNGLILFSYYTECFSFTVIPAKMVLGHCKKPKSLVGRTFKGQVLRLPKLQSYCGYHWLIFYKHSLNLLDFDWFQTLDFLKHTHNVSLPQN